MAQEDSWLVNFSQYAGLRAVSAALHTSGIDRNLATARAAGSLMYRLDRRHRERALDSISRSLPARGSAEVERTAEQSMQHFLQLGVEVLFTPRLIHLDTFADHVRLSDLGKALDLLLSDRPTLLVTGHIGNWEILGYVLTTLGLDLHAVARPIDNPMINDWLLGVRERRGMRTITKWGATETMVDVLNGGGTLGFIGDQNAGRHGMYVPFFGRLASTYKSIGLLAIHFDAPVICGYAFRVGGRFQFEIGMTDIILPEDWKSQPDPLFYLTARYSRAIERMVRMRPAQYLWIHRRWKSRPRFERLGRPMPRRVQQRLQALPWMTEEDLERLREASAA